MQQQDCSIPARSSISRDTASCRLKSLDANPLARPGDIRRLFTRKEKLRAAFGSMARSQ